MSYKIGEVVKLRGSFDYNNKIGTIIKIDEDYPYAGNKVQRLLVQGKDLGGAVEVIDGVRTFIKDSRYAYDFMVERV